MNVVMSACGDGGGSTNAGTQSTATADATANTGPTSAESMSTGSASTGAVGTDTSLPTTTANTTGGEHVAGLDLMDRLAGLWSGPATMTPLGSFPLMNMDFRAASGHVLFSRVDLDTDNSLRFAFEVEDHGGGPVLVYRNGGSFLGIERDTRTTLVEHSGSMWRFCARTAEGCDYIDAVWTLEAEDHVVLNVHVKGQQHLTWNASRKETRTLPETFPVDESTQAMDAPFPPMPSLQVDVTWSMPLEQDGAVWVILTTTPCDLQQLKCVHSRSLLADATAGETAIRLNIGQIHAGDYQLTAVLDRNSNMAETMFPDAGDGVSIPNKAITVTPTGESKASATIVLDL